jgi:hypothetical protein
MVKHNMVVELLMIVPLDGVCEGSMVRKHHQGASETSKAWRVKTQLELVHSDPFSLKKTLLIGSSYVLTFIDDFSIYNGVYFLKNKSHVFKKFKKFRAVVEKKCD